MKKIIIILVVLLLTGCTCKYELEFDGDKIKETITSYVYPEDYEEKVPGVDLDDLASHLVNDDQYPLVNSDNTYNKTVTDMGNYQEVVLDYVYNVDDFKNYSQVINCFENKYFEYKDGEYKVRLSGEFYCLYGDSIEIEISSKKHITSANGLKKLNKYTWSINDDNYLDVNIEFEISDVSLTRYYIYIGIVIVIAIGLIVFGYNFFSKIINRNDVNKI